MASRTGGLITVQVRLEQSMLHIVIEDNGSGMDTAKVERGMAEMTLSKKGYALVNIRHRLQLYYGSAARMELSAVSGRGSRTDLWIPAVSAGEGGTASYGTGSAY